MKAAEQAAKELGDKNPAVGLKAVATLRNLMDKLERVHVDNARAQGWSWNDIAEVLGVSKQAVHTKHARRFGLVKRRS